MATHTEDLKMALERAANRLELLADLLPQHTIAILRWAEQARRVLDGVDYEEAHKVD